MRTISQREFRNKSAQIIRDLERGETFLLTNNGQPVGTLTPAGSPNPEPPPSRPATRRGGFKMPVREPKESTATTLAELRGER